MSSNPIVLFAETTISQIAKVVKTANRNLCFFAKFYLNKSAGIRTKDHREDAFHFSFGFQGILSGSI